VYDAAHFLHVVGALGLTAAFGVEAAGLVGLRRATDADEALLWLRSRRWVLLIGPASIGLVLATGIYLTVVEWGPDAWILVSLASLAAVAGIGGFLIGIPWRGSHLRLSGLQGRCLRSFGVACKARSSRSRS
jgi:hypothetical protein